MFGHKRKPKIKTKRNNKKRLIAFYGLILGSSIFFAGGIAFLLYMQQQEPVIISPIDNVKALSAGQHDDEQVKIIEKALRDKSILYSDIATKDSLYIVRLENGGEVTLSAKKDIIAQISSLHFILTRLTMEGRQFQRLDLQFDKPIIIFKE